MKIGAALLVAGTALGGTYTLAPATTLAQTGPAGTWRVESTPPGSTWTAALRVDGKRVIGAVSSCSSRTGEIEIFDGLIDGNTITFKCKSGNGVRTMIFAGEINGDEIVFRWEKSGPGEMSADRALFGAAAPPRFTARRVADTSAANLVEAADRIRRRSVAFDRILHADQEPQNWLTYSGDVQGHRHSALTQISRANVKELELAWLYQAPTNSQLEATPLVVEGVLYTTRNTNDVVALDAATGRVRWVFPYTPAEDVYATGGGGRPNRGLAILGNALFLATLDAHLLAIDATSGKLIWDTAVADARDPACAGGACYVMTLAPLIVKNKVIVGVSGGEGRTRGFVAAFESDTGKEAWRFYTIPASGEPGNNTWAGDSWKIGGAPVWNTGAFDADLNLTYWGTGNPYPPYDGATRDGDNLYSNSVVALDADTGTLKWHFQFTPHDVQDWDSAQVPVLADLLWRGQPRKVMLWANRNGLLYVLDRTTGEFLMGKPFVEVNWMNGVDAKGRPILAPGRNVSLSNPVRPGSATNWIPDSYSPSTGWFYVAGWERAAAGAEAVRGKSYSAVRAFDPSTGDRKWEFRIDDAGFSGVLTTASDLLFSGTAGDSYSDPADARRVDGYFYALDARSGQLLWKFALTGSIQSPPITYAIQGRQYIAVAAKDTLFAFALRQ